jgi:sarcosine oxidase subunit gamma
LSEAPPAARFILRGGEGARVACGIAFGAEPPSRLGPAGEGVRRAALWLGPDEWLMIADGADAAPLGEMLESVLDGTAHSLVDVSHRQIGLIASGPAAARVLNAGCPLDLDPRAFPVGMATRTLYDKAEIVLWRRGESAFHVEVWRSFAPHVAASLIEAARGAPEW